MIKNKLYPITGAVTMDWFMVNLGERTDIKIGDDVLLMGYEKNSDLGADNLAESLKTVPYEILCAVADRVRRIYIN